MIRRLAIRALRPVRRVMLWLTGQRELHDALRAGMVGDRLDRLEATLGHDIYGLDRHATQLRAEVDRLDSYLVYHAGELGSALDRLSTQVRQLESRLSSEIQQSEARANQIIYSSSIIDIILTTSLYDLVIPSTDVGLAAYYRRHGIANVEAGPRAVVARFVKPGDLVIDGGANVGLFTMDMARLTGPTGSVISIEANARIAGAVQKTLVLNNVHDRVRVVQAAIADRDGAASFFYGAHSPLGSLYETVASSDADSHPVELVRLDDLVEAGRAVSFIKLDIEGAEPAAWRGMERIRSDSPDLKLILEWSASHFRNSGVSAAEFLQQIEHEGFRLYVVDPETGMLTVFDGNLGSLEATNVFLTRGEV